MGNKANVEAKMDVEFEKYRKLKTIKKEIENSEYWGITRRLAQIEHATTGFSKHANVRDGYGYAQSGFERMHANAESMKKKTEAYQEWRTAQITMKVRVTEEMETTSKKIWELQNTYNANKDEGDIIGIQKAHNTFRW